MPPGTTAKDLLDVLMQSKGTSLDQWLAERRADGLSYNRIAVLLHDEWSFDTTAQTVSTWCAAQNGAAR